MTLYADLCYNRPKFTLERHAGALMQWLYSRINFISGDFISGFYCIAQIYTHSSFHSPPTNQVDPHCDGETEDDVKGFLSRLPRFFKQRSELVLRALGHEVDVMELGAHRFWESGCWGRRRIRSISRPRYQFRVDVDAIDEQRILRTGEMRCNTTRELLEKVGIKSLRQFFGLIFLKSLENTMNRSTIKHLNLNYGEFQWR